MWPVILEPCVRDLIIAVLVYLTFVRYDTIRSNLCLGQQLYYCLNKTKATNR